MTPTAFDTFVSTLRKQTRWPIETGTRDINGREIRTGDIVEFWFGEVSGYTPAASEGSTRMVDVVEYRDGVFYAVDYDTRGGVFLWQLDGVCTVIGDVHANPDELKSLLRFSHLGRFLGLSV